ncbi:sensor histidine kinase [Streptomonospora salina]|uniref:histidine kinase n=1 Tax=Streptomonospora salina TaxID=104205 RepID=A0A841EKK3_9ACTN|nr:histidine kinase [Streptomonospora salina]MBB5999941.1 signal transduction histidine kinase [Streptomonospora salina]
MGALLPDRGAAVSRAARSARYTVSTGVSSLHAWLLLSGFLFTQALVILLVGAPVLRRLAELLERSSERDVRLARAHLARDSEADGAAHARAEFWTAVRWSAVNSLAGLACTLPAFVLAVGVIVSLTCPLWWWMLPPSIAVSPGGYPVDSWPAALLTPLVGIAYLGLFVFCVPRLATGHALLALRMLTTPGKARLRTRIAEVTALRQTALEAHGLELRRIERDLHDGTQNRLVAVRMQLGLVERLLAEDPDRSRELIAATKSAAEDALKELRNVVRSIYPPILADQGLATAVASLASRSAIPCTVDVRELPRLPAAVETAAYFVVTEALTNVAKHSGAASARVAIREHGGEVTVEVTDDGRGGADERGGGGLSGIRQRAAAFEGRTRITSPPEGPTTIEVRLPCAF